MDFKQTIFSNKGFSTLEMLMAMFILVLTLTAVVGVSFGNQSMIIDSQTNAEALNIAQGLLEKAQADSRKDFNLVNPVEAVTSADGFTSKVDVMQQAGDYFTKLVTATVEFPEDNGRQGKTELSTLVTNFNNAVGGDTCNSAIPSHWMPGSPDNYSLNPIDLLAGSGLPADTYPITSLDSYRNFLYVAASNTLTGDDRTLFIFDISNPGQRPVYKGSVDNSSSTKIGINAIKVAGNYAYAASAIEANFNTTAPDVPCNNEAGTNASCGQLQVIDASIPENPQVKYTFEVPNAVGHDGQAVGKSVFYKNGYVYLGLSKTASGSEFNIIDVHNFPAVAPSFVGSFLVGGGVESIYVNGDYAYLGTDVSGRELTVLDISNPQNPNLAGYFNVGAGNGNSLYVVGDNLYLGSRYVIGQPEFNITSIASLNPAASTPLVGYNDIGSDSSSPFSVNGVIVRNTLAFILAGSASYGGNLQLFDIAPPGSLSTEIPVATVPLPVGGSGIGGVAMDCESNYIYVGSVDGSGNSYLSIITGQ